MIHWTFEGSTEENGAPEHLLAVELRNYKIGRQINHKEFTGHLDNFFEKSNIKWFQKEMLKFLTRDNSGYKISRGDSYFN